MSIQNSNDPVESSTHWIVGHDPGNEVTTAASLDLQVLEDRVLYSAGPLPVDLAAPIDVVEPGFESLDGFDSIETQLNIISEGFDSEVFGVESDWEPALDQFSFENADSILSSTNELVIVDTSVENFEQLVDDLLQQRSGDRLMEVVYLSSSTDGVAQISSILASRVDLNAIHIVSHGDDGELRLGSSVLNEGSLSRFEAEISGWSNSLHDSGDVLIYGCNVAESAEGEEFVQQLSELMGSDVLASSDVTGIQSLGGDWDFEYQVGSIEASIAFSVTVQQEWHSVLSIPVTADPLNDVDADTSHDGQGSKQAIAMDDDGNYVVVWSSNGDGSFGWRVLAQRYDNLGTAVGPEIAVNQNIGGDQEWASVAMDANGNFVVTWTDDDHNEINIRRYSANGNPITGEIRVNDPSTTGTASGSTIAMNSSGEFVVTWVGEGMGNQKEIYASAFASDGTVILENFIVNSTTGNDQIAPDVSINETGNFVVTWHDGNGVYAQRFNANGSTNGSEIDVISNTTFPTRTYDFASVGLQNDGSFAVSYIDTVGGNQGPDVRMFDASGVFVGQGDDNETVTNYQGDASLQVGADGTYILVWEGFGNQAGEGDGDGVFARLLDSNGDAISGEFRINDYTTGSQNNVSVAIHDEDHYVFVYSGNSAGDSQGVYTELFVSNYDPTLNDESVNIDEDADIDDLVIDLNATDPDDTSFTYEIDGGNVGGVFSIDSDSGEITVDDELDFETRSSYTLQVTVTDDEGASDSADITININNVVETSISGTIFEDEIGDGSIAGDGGVSGVTVALYQDDGDGEPDAADTLVATTTTSPSGIYQFNDLADGDYYVVVDSKTITPTAGFNAGFGIGDVWAEQTYATSGAVTRNPGNGNIQTLGSGQTLIGGATAIQSDDATGIATAENLNFISFSGNEVSDVDFGFSFNVVTNLLGGGSEDDDLANNRTVQGSLRQFIQNANAISGANAMRFVPLVDANESSSDDWWSLAVSVALPEITDEGTTLDGRAYESDGVTLRNENKTWLGYSGTVGVGADGVAGSGDEALLAALDAPDLEIYDAAGLGEGLIISASNTEVSNLAIHGFGSSNNDGGNIYVDGTSNSVTNVTIRDNVLGSSADAFAAGDAQVSNITVRQADMGLIQNNLIGFADMSGILIAGSNDSVDGANNWQIIGNEIRDNGRNLANMDGINIIRGSGSTTVMQNLIVDNAGLGVDTWRSAGGHTISNNTITGNGHGGVETGGVRLFGTGNSIELNEISNNLGSGVHVIGEYDNGSNVIDASTGNLISKNSFSNNSGAAIDLSSSNSNSTVFGQGDGVSGNATATDVDAGNDGLDHPELTEAFIDSDGLHVFGTLEDNLNISVLELYVANSGAGDYAGGVAYGEGTTFLGSVAMNDLVSYDPITGEFELLISPPTGGWPSGLAGTGSVTAISIQDLTNNTSEFSNAEIVGSGEAPVISNDEDIYKDENRRGLGRIKASDADNDPITFSITGGDDRSFFQIDSLSGRLKFINRPDFENPLDGGSKPLDNIYEVEVTASDDNHRSSSKLFQVHVEDVDEDPTAVVDSYSVLEGGFFIQDVTQNDIDPENSSFDIRIIGEPNYGSALVTPNGNVLYRHDGNEEFTDQFVYEITDAGGNLSSATVFVMVDPVEDPTQVTDDQIVGEFEQPITIHKYAILSNDSDPDSSPSEMNVSITKNPDHGVLSIVNGQLVFTPNLDFVGRDTIEYEVEEGGATSNTGVIEIFVGGPAVETPVDETETLDEEVEPVDPANDLEGEGPAVTGSNDDSEDESEFGKTPNNGHYEHSTNSLYNETESDENASRSANFKLDPTGATYAYSSRTDGLSLANLAEIIVSSGFSSQLSQFESTLLAGLLWDDLDSAKRDFIQGNMQLGVHEIAASAASFLTVGYLAWIIRGGVLLTTFMSSIPTWSAFDIQSVLEAADGSDESIEQMVDA